MDILKHNIITKMKCKNKSIKTYPFSYLTKNRTIIQRGPHVDCSKYKTWKYNVPQDHMNNGH